MHPYDSVFLDKNSKTPSTPAYHIQMYTPMEWNGKLYVYTVIISDYKWAYMGYTGVYMGMSGHTLCTTGVYMVILWSYTGVHRYTGFYEYLNKYTKK